LPTRYNDDARIEQSKYWQTSEEIVARFGAMTWQPEILKGIWLHESRRYEEENVRFFVDVEDTEDNAAFFRELKGRLKARFRQIDIT
jgi:hypothetical protein